ncbi:MAG: MbcA/ParS/Xre antitoxin family protein [Candidatus Velthaea sp.]
MVDSPSRSRSAGAIRAYLRVADRWKLARGERATLLATSDRSIDRWTKRADEVTLNRDQLERLSYILGIYGGLHAILGESSFAEAWVREPNRDFGGQPPIRRMLAGNVADLLDVRRYIERWQTGW